MALHQHSHSLDMSLRTGVVVLAAGHGERLGRGPKALIRVGDKPLLLHVLDSMATNVRVNAIVVTAPDDMVAEFQELADSMGPAVPIRVTPGGPTRQDSGHAGVAALPPEVDCVAVTDVARPFTPTGTIDRLLEDLRTAARDARPGRGPCGIVPALPLVDSVHLRGEGPLLKEPFDRSLLRAAQTPQLFHRSCLTAAYEAAAKDGAACTDDAGMISRFGGTVATSPGDAANFKITYEYDLALAEAFHAHAAKALVERGAGT